LEAAVSPPSSPAPQPSRQAQGLGGGSPPSPHYPLAVGGAEEVARCVCSARSAPVPAPTRAGLVSQGARSSGWDSRCARNDCLWVPSCRSSLMRGSPGEPGHFSFGQVPSPCILAFPSAQPAGAGIGGRQRPILTLAFSCCSFPAPNLAPPPPFSSSALQLSRQCGNAETPAALPQAIAGGACGVQVPARPPSQTPRRCSICGLGCRTGHTLSRVLLLLFFFTLHTGPRRSLSLNLSGTRV